VKIWYITTGFPVPRETFTHGDIKTLQRLGHDVEVRCLLPPHQNWAELVEQWNISVATNYPTFGIYLRGLFQVIRWPSAFRAALRCSLSGNRRLVHLLKGLVVIPRALELLVRYRQQRPDIVHLYWGHFPSIVGYVIKTACPESTVTMFLGAYDLTTKFSGTTIMASVADAIFTHAQANIPSIEAIGADPQKVVLAYRGIDPDRLDLPTLPKIRHSIVSVGALVKPKGMHRVLEVFKRVQATLPDASLAILGDGEERNALETLVERHQLQNVEITGYVPHQEVLTRLRKAEVFLYLSESDRLPNAVKEAIAADCACIVSRTPGIEELVPPDGGFVVSAGDSDAACSAVFASLSAAETIEPMKRKAKLNLARHFNANATMQIYVDKWSELINRSL
jgi:glycosyltransferase involved in cell wall biosynthesis